MKQLKLIAVLSAILMILPICMFAADLPEGGVAKNGTIGYQIFVGAFADGDASNNDKAINFESGDLQGIIDNLDYLKENLSVNCLWLTPVHKSTLSYHKYDVDDYYSIDPAFGSLETYKTLLEEAHKRGIYVLMDLVLNHSSSNNAWFVEAWQNPKSPYRNFYRFAGKEKEGKSPWSVVRKDPNQFYYCCFAPTMPDLNYDNEATYTELLKICKYWLDMGVDGFRIDGAKHVFNRLNGKTEAESTNAPTKNEKFFLRFGEDIRKIKNDAFLVAELWDDNPDYIAPYLAGINSGFNFGIRSKILSMVNLSSARQMNLNGYPKVVASYSRYSDWFTDSIFVANHDTPRVYAMVRKDPEKVNLVGAISFTMPGITWIYSGDELGLSGEQTYQSYADMKYRQPYKWGKSKKQYITRPFYIGNEYVNYTNAWDDYNLKLKEEESQLKDKKSTLNVYKYWTAFKANDKVIRNGDFKDVTFKASDFAKTELADKVYGFLRSYEGTTYLVLHNLYEKNLTVPYNLENATIVAGDFNVKKLKSDSVTLVKYGSVVIKLP